MKLIWCSRPLYQQVQLVEGSSAFWNTFCVLCFASQRSFLWNSNNCSPVPLQNKPDHFVFQCCEGGSIPHSTALDHQMPPGGSIPQNEPIHIVLLLTTRCLYWGSIPQNEPTHIVLLLTTRCPLGVHSMEWAYSAFLNTLHVLCFASQRSFLWKTNKENLSDHRCDRTNMATKCRIFVTVT